MIDEKFTDGAKARQLIQMIAGTYGKDELTLEVCTVDNVYTAVSDGVKQWTCDATPASGNNTTQLTGILLTASPASNGWIKVPAIGSNIIVGLTVKNDYYVWLCTDIEELICIVTIGNTKYASIVINPTDTDGQIVLQDGSFGGIPINAKILTNLNAILTYINDIAAAISGAGSGDAIPAAVAAVAPSTEPTMEDMQNGEVIHGITNTTVNT